MIVAMATSILLVMTTILTLYETLRLTSNHLAELPVPPRARIIVVVLAAFFGHTVAVWTYAVAYWVLAFHLQLGSFSGLPDEDFLVASIFPWSPTRRSASAIRCRCPTPD